MVSLYSNLFGRPLSPVRRAITVATFLFAGASIVFGSWVILGLWFGYRPILGSTPALPNGEHPIVAAINALREEIVRRLPDPKPYETA